MTNHFEDGRNRRWREHLDEDGRPTCGPEESLHRGCQHCGGPLDATSRTGVYSCPWCIARYTPELGLEALKS